jgi:thiol-disulfide isomerase/thioredoxin
VIFATFAGALCHGARGGDILCVGDFSADPSGRAAMSQEHFMRRLNFVFAAAAAFGAAFPAIAADDPKTPAAVEAAAEDNAKPEDSKDAPDPFAVPEGSDAKVLQDFLKKVAGTRPSKQTPEAIREHLRKLDRIALEIMGRQVDDPTVLMTIDFRFSVLSNLIRFGDEKGTEDRTAMVEALLKDERPVVAERGTIFGLATRISTIDQLDAAARKQLIVDVGEFVRSGELTGERLEFADVTASNLEQIGDNELAIVANNLFAKSFAARNDEKVAEVIEAFKTNSRRLELPGNPILVKGKTIAGEDFDIEQYKGKVVLVDFWATWCGPCLAEMPHIKDLYSQYHDKGFEIVGVSLDYKKDALEEYVTAEKIAWVQLFHEGESPEDPNPIAKFYGINGIPKGILVNREGKVVSLQALGKNLDEELEKLFGPAEKKPEPDADEGKKETPAEGTK